MLRGWADKMEAAVRAERHRVSQSEFFRRHMDQAWHWAVMAERLGRPPPAPVDRVVVKERTPVVPAVSPPPEIVLPGGGRETRRVGVTEGQLTLQAGSLVESLIFCLEADSVELPIFDLQMDSVEFPIFYFRPCQA